MSKTDLLERTLEEIDHAVDKATDQILALEHKEHLVHPKLFKTHSKHLRKKIEKVLSLFKHSFVHGYEIILEHALEMSEKQAFPLKTLNLKSLHNQMNTLIKLF